MRQLAVNLPYPPSLNHYWRHTRQGRHYISKAGKTYRDAVLMACVKEKPFQSQVSIHIDVFVPDNRKRDPDNLWKVVLDSLTQANIIEDDCWQVVPRQSIDVVAVDKHNPRLVVTIKELT
ncbi:crossover junction endodeoxyribonuclease RusA [Volucribacter psittacicida]|uniref:Crossover junction endodeoxyribonuclease rusA n=1 Tax=Volucribacter psittacicida TaxID=203482 RepID=A0A4R1FME6_9PAST|nr:RusA family crossover junction endodeoxyribonuclease [Volucribacter psittacicida]TCJ96166.1 crossover junction endodeoxyribonuclease RusA [Volucribacter psittacicida]